MNIHVRLREEQEADIITWYEAQEDKSGAVREAIRAYMRLHNGDTQEAVVKAVVAGELARLPDVVAAAVREALAGYRFSDAVPEAGPGDEDPELAARLDAGLDEWFKDGDQ